MLSTFLPLPHTAPLAGDDAESWLREAVHSTIDALASVAQRLLELPLIAALAAGTLGACALWYWARFLSRRGTWPRLSLGLRVFAGLLVVAAPLLAFDHQLARSAARDEQTREHHLAATAALLEQLMQHGMPRHDLLVDLGGVKARLAPTFGDATLRGVALDAATDLVLFHIREPKVAGSLAVVDLRDPDVAIAIDADFVTKTLTSDFASAHACTIAINGEAGRSAHPGCGLGRWTGNMVIAGTPVLHERPEEPRPFLCFDRGNRARFVAGSATKRELRPTDHHVIWGRVDAIVDGVGQRDPYRFNQPRTVMGIDAAGQRLFLLVVDGRQPARSVGFTHEQVAQFLLAFEVHDAMLCDEGGSACMFASAFGGLVTVPSDNRGEERPTYTHFGIRKAMPGPAPARH